VIVTVHKAAGQTPLEALDALRARQPHLAASPMVYAGRLDPMADGLLLVLTDEDRLALDVHLRHDKDYVATFLFCLRSDSQDALGRLALGSPPEPAACREAVTRLAGVHTLALPAYSSYRVRGRALHAWAREGRLDEVVVPVRDMQVHAVHDVSVATLDARTAARDACARITCVRGDFRQAESQGDWTRVAIAAPAVVAVTALLTVSSGTYVRALAQALGERLGCGGLLFRLTRTRIGPYRAAEPPAADVAYSSLQSP
jgi:tRNA pseudouridine55 synthase